MTVARNIVVMVQNLVRKEVDSIRPRRVIVNDTNIQGRVSIKELGSDEESSEYYARLDGSELVEGDEVLVLDVNGKPVVLGKIIR